MARKMSKDIKFRNWTPASAGLTCFSMLPINHTREGGALSLSSPFFSDELNSFTLAVPRPETEAITPYLAFFQRAVAMIRKRLIDDSGGGAGHAGGERVGSRGDAERHTATHGPGTHRDGQEHAQARLDPARIGAGEPAVQRAAAAGQVRIPA